MNIYTKLLSYYTCKVIRKTTTKNIKSTTPNPFKFVLIWKRKNVHKSTRATSKTFRFEVETSLRHKTQSNRKITDFHPQYLCSPIIQVRYLIGCRFSDFYFVIVIFSCFKNVMCCLFINCSSSLVRCVYIWFSGLLFSEFRNNCIETNMTSLETKIHSIVIIIKLSGNAEIFIYTSDNNH